MKANIAIYHLLSNATDVTDIVGANIFPNVVPQGKTGDSITYSITNVESFDGKGAYNDYNSVSVQISCFCEKYDKTGDLVEAVRTALDRESGTFGTDTTVEVDNIFFQNMQDVGFLDKVKKYHKVIDFIVCVL